MQETLWQTRVRLIREKVAALVTKANARYGITLPNIVIRFESLGRAAGRAGRTTGQVYYMKFNNDMMMNEGWDHMYKDTVPHELAHVVCLFNPQLGANHNYGWYTVCRFLGGSGERTHNELVTYAKGRTFEYTTKIGKTVRLSQTRHNRVQEGAAYLFREGGRVDKTCAFKMV